MKYNFAMTLLAVAVLAAVCLCDSATAPLARAQAPAAAASMLDLFYMGNRASRLESCGCHSRQQGGLQYEAVIYDQHAPRPSVRVDIGDWTTFAINQRPVDLMTTRYLLRAMTMLKLDAVNVGLRDMELTTDYFKVFKEKYPAQQPPLISANVFLKGQAAQHAFPTYNITEKKLSDGTTIKVGITGVAWLTDENYSLPRGVTDLAERETINYIARRPKDCLAPVIAELRPKVDLLIVLSTGDTGSAAEIAKAFPKVDVVISRNVYDEPQVIDGLEGSVRLLFGRSSQGKELGYVPLEHVKDGRWQFGARPALLPVAKDVNPKPEYLALIEEFKKETQTLKPKLPPPDAKDLYAGAITCQMCHPKQYDSWKQTRHAQAMATLLEKGQQFNPACLKCHVTGFQEANGFYAINHRPSEKMINVQCEVCHGPGMIHALAQRMKPAGRGYMSAEEYDKRLEEEKRERPHKAVPEKICKGCHTPENDDTFDYKLKLPKVAHGAMK